MPPDNDNPDDNVDQGEVTSLCRTRSGYLLRSVELGRHEARMAMACGERMFIFVAPDERAPYD